MTNNRYFNDMINNTLALKECVELFQKHDNEKERQEEELRNTINYLKQENESLKMKIESIEKQSKNSTPLQSPEQQMKFFMELKSHCMSNPYCSTIYYKCEYYTLCKQMRDMIEGIKQ